MRWDVEEEVDVLVRVQGGICTSTRTKRWMHRAVDEEVDTSVWVQDHIK